MIKGAKVPCDFHKSPSDPTAKAREIARKILHPDSLECGKQTCIEAQRRIAAALEAERKAGYDEGVDFAARQHAKLRQATWFMDGYRQGLEEAAKIVDRHERGIELCAEGVADRIRAKAGEGK